METSVIDEEARQYCDAEEIRRFIREFEECTLPKSEWNHPAHLTVALWYLMERSEIEAITCIRNGILRYNGANGIKTTANSGYHETITCSGPDSWPNISQLQMPGRRSWNWRTA